MPTEDDLRDALRGARAPGNAVRQIDVGAVLSRSRRRRLPGQVALGGTVGLAIAGIGVAGFSAIRPLGFGGDTGSSLSSGPTENADQEAAAGGAAGGDSIMLAPAEKLNLCGGQLAEVAPSASGLVATADFPAAEAGVATVEGVVTITNTGDAPVSGTTSAVPSVTLSQDGLVLWHSNGATIAMVVDVSLAPGESQTYPASLTPVRCDVEDDLGEAFRDELPALEPGDYEVSAAIYLIDGEGTHDLITGPLSPVRLD